MSDWVMSQMERQEMIEKFLGFSQEEKLICAQCLPSNILINEMSERLNIMSKASKEVRKIYAELLSCETWLFQEMAEEERQR